MGYPLWHGSIPMEVFIDSAPGAPRDAGPNIVEHAHNCPLSLEVNQYQGIAAHDHQCRKGTVRQHLLHA